MNTNASFDYYSIPVIIFTHPYIENARKALSAIAAQQLNPLYNPTTIVILHPQLERKYLYELLNIDNVILIRGTTLSWGNGNNDENEPSNNNININNLPYIASMDALRVSLTVFPSVCIVVVNPSDTTFVQSSKVIWKYTSPDTFIDIPTPKRFNCTDEFPTAFKSNNKNIKSSFLLPSFYESSQKFQSLGSEQDKNNTNDPFNILWFSLYNQLLNRVYLIQELYWPISSYSQYSQIIQMERSYQDGPTECFKRHILRSNHRSFILTNHRPNLAPPSNKKLSPTNPLKLLCLCIPLREFRSTFFDISLPSLVYTAGISSNNNNNNIQYHLYLGWESSDSYFSKLSNRQYFQHHAEQILNHSGNNNNNRIILIEFPDMEQDIVHIWNSMFLMAYDDGCDYLMHATDDVDYNRTKGAGLHWPSKFIQLLSQQKNIGAIGNYQLLNTMPMVHRTHLEIFDGIFYPPRLHNTNSDTVVWTLYKSLGFLAGPDELEHWINLSDVFDPLASSHARLYRDCGFPGQGVDFIPNWIEFNPAQVKRYLNVIYGKEKGIIQSNNLRLNPDELLMLDLIDKSPNFAGPSTFSSHFISIIPIKSSCQIMQVKYNFICERNHLPWSCVRDSLVSAAHYWKFSGLHRYKNQQKTTFIVVIVKDSKQRLYLKSTTTTTTNSRRNHHVTHQLWNIYFAEECTKTTWPSVCLEDMIQSRKLVLPAGTNTVKYFNFVGGLLIDNDYALSILEFYVYVLEIEPVQPQQQLPVRPHNNVSTIGGPTMPITLPDDGKILDIAFQQDKSSTTGEEEEDKYVYRWLIPTELDFNDLYVNPLLLPSFQQLWFPHVVRLNNNFAFYYAMMIEVSGKYNPQVKRACSFNIRV
jgi:hypothetical protein